MESIQQPISQRKRNWIIAAALAIGCIWGMLVFYSIVDRNQDDLTVAPKGSYAPQTPAPAAIGSSSFYQAPRYNAPTHRRVITHQPSVFGYTPAPNAAMGSTSSGTAMRVHQTSSATLQSYGGSGSGGGVDGNAGRSVAGHFVVQRGGGDVDPVFAGPVSAADGLDVEVVFGLFLQTVNHVDISGDIHLGTLTLDESGIAVLDSPALCRRIGGPVEGHAAGGNVASRSISNIGASSGGESEGIAPVARNQAGATEGLNAGVVGHTGSEAAQGNRIGGAEIEAIQACTVPNVDVPVGFLANGGPVKLCCGIGDIGNTEVFGSDAAQTVGEYDSGGPNGVNTIGAVLTHTDHIAGGGSQTGEGVGARSDSSQRGDVVGPSAGSDGHIESVGSGKP